MTDPRWRVTLTPAAQRQLRRLPPGDAARMRGPILSLAIDQHPPGAARIIGTQYWRLRVGDMRIIYVVDMSARAILILRVARRSESTYRSLDR